MLMQQFEVTLKNDKIKFYKSIALLLVLMNLAVFIFLLMSGIHFYVSAAAILLSGLYLIYSMYRAKKNRDMFFIKEITFLVLAVSWVMLQNYLVALACIILGLLYHWSLQKLRLHFSSNVVTKMNFPQKAYSWGLLANVKLKDNILTMDFRNNKLIQLEIECDINEMQFNEFAQRQLFKAGIR